MAGTSGPLRNASWRSRTIGAFGSLARNSATSAGTSPRPIPMFQLTTRSVRARRLACVEFRRAMTAGPTAADQRSRVARSASLAGRIPDRRFQPGPYRVWKADIRRHTPQTQHRTATVTRSGIGASRRRQEGDRTWVTGKPRSILAAAPVPCGPLPLVATAVHVLTLVQLRLPVALHLFFATAVVALGTACGSTATTEVTAPSAPSTRCQPSLSGSAYVLRTDGRHGKCDRRCLA